MKDLSKLARGDVVLIEAVLAGIDDHGSLHFYGKDGCEYLDTWLTEKQAKNVIKEIIAKPFNWDDVKIGDRFTSEDSDEVWCFLCFNRAGAAVLETVSKSNYHIDWYSKNHLTPAPEHDKEAKS